MKRQTTFSLLVALAVLGAAGCAAPTGTGAAGDTRVGIANNAAGLMANNTGSLVANNTGNLVANNTGNLVANNTGNLIANNAGGLIANNTGSLTGILKGPSAGLIANNAAGLIANNAAGLVSNNAAGLVSSGSASFRVQDIDSNSSLTPGVEVAVFNEQGEQVSYGTTTTDVNGRYYFDRLKASGPLLFVKASFSQEGQQVTLVAAASAPRDAVVLDVPINAATTLVAKKVNEMVNLGAVPLGAIKADTIAAVVNQVGPLMTSKAVVAATIASNHQGAQVFDAMLLASPNLARAVGAVATAAGLAKLSAKTPDAPVGALPTATPAPTSTQANGTAGTVSTIAGDGSRGFADGTATGAEFALPYGLALDARGNLFVGDFGNNRVRKIDPTGGVSTLAGAGVIGYADGSGGQALFASPRGIAVDGSGNLFVADTGNHRIRKVDAVGNVSTIAGDGTAGFADGPGSQAKFNNPRGIALDAAGNVYVADTQNYRIRKIDAAGNVTTLAGDGKAGFVDGAGAAAEFKGPYGLAVDAAGTVYTADFYAHAIRAIDRAGNVTTLAGNGSPGNSDGPSAQFAYPAGLAVGSNGTLYVADYGNNRIAKVSAGGVVTTLAGSHSGVAGSGGFADGSAATAQFNGPYGVAVDGAGTVYVTDTSNQRVRKIRP